MKRIKRITAIFALIIMVSSMTSVCSALTIAFNRKYVDSSSLTLVCSGEKDSTSSTAELSITDIFTETGTPSNFRRVRAKMMPTGVEEIAEKGVVTVLSIPSRYQTAGSTVSLYCRGNNPAFSCQITGSINIH